MERVIRMTLVEKKNVVLSLDQALRATSYALLRPTYDEAIVRIPQSHLRLLQMIDRMPSAKMVEIATALDVHLPAVSQIVDKLSSQGLVVRVPDAIDRRVTRLALTEGSERLLADATDARIEKMEVATSSLTEAQLSVLITLLTKINGDERVTQTATR